MDEFMRYLMNKKALLIGFLITGVICTSCEMLKKSELTAHPDPNGSINEQIAYHKSEIKKYQTALDKENEVSLKALTTRDMSEVRRSNNKKDRYERKIKDHQKALMKLENEQRQDSSK